MAERGGPRLYTISAHRAFADALAAGLLRRFGGDDLGLARGIVLLPNNRAKRAINDAFVRASGAGLLLPRLIAIGDPTFDEGAGAIIDPAGEEPLPPAVAPLRRRLILARLVAEARREAGEPIDADAAVRLAGDLARTLDQLLVEEVAPRRLREIVLTEELATHWQRSLDLLGVVLDRWPQERERRGEIDAAARRGLLLDRLAARWRETPPPGFVCAAGITDAAPAVARLLRTVSELPGGMVVFADLATDLDAAEWASLGPHRPDPETGQRRRAVPTHPQYALKQLLDRMGVNRAEVTLWREGGGHDAAAARSKAIASAFAPAAFTSRWTDLEPAQRRLGGITVAELATPAEEAQAIAIALRGQLEQPGATAALVTPDRALARRVAAHCRRWGIEIDDSAGRPLSLTPPGALLALIADAAVQLFAPLALLALLKHPLVRSGEVRAAWLEGARALDLALRGPRPAPGLEGIDAHLAEGGERDRRTRAAAAAWWGEARAMLAPLEAAFAGGSLADLLAALREAAQALCGDVVWTGPAGRAAASLIEELETAATDAPPCVDPAAFPALLRVLMDEVAVRPPQGGHPRLAIYGLIEARLQQPDLMILGGLNEGVWPAQPGPDPWLAPRIRTDLGLPGLEEAIGIAAHDLAGGLGAPRVLLTRARRDASQPAVASRFWLRLRALAGTELTSDEALIGWARAIDTPPEHRAERRPAPNPPRDRRPTEIAVTDVDLLQADPYSYYAKRVLGLAALDPVDADPSAAWRGTAVHAILEQWGRQDRCAPDALIARAQAMLADARTHPLMRALWQPRLMQAIEWIATETAGQHARGRRVVDVEREGRISLAGVTLKGKFDRVDRFPDGSIAILDYKTGAPPSMAKIRAGFGLQLALLGLIARGGGFAGLSGDPRDFEYWSLQRRRGGEAGFGYIQSPVDPGRRDHLDPDAFLALARETFDTVVATWLTGDASFEPKVRPEYAPYRDYDQLMRFDEWYGRDG